MQNQTENKQTSQPVKLSPTTGLSGWSKDDMKNIRLMAYSPDGKWIAICDHQKLYIHNNRDQISELPPVYSHDMQAICFSPCSQYLVVSTGDKVNVYKVSPWTQQLTWCIPAVVSIDFSKDGKYIAFASKSHGLYVFNLTEPKWRIDMTRVADFNECYPFASATSGPCSLVSFFPSGNKVACVCKYGDGSKILVYQANDRQHYDVCYEYPTAICLSLAISSNGKIYSGWTDESIMANRMVAKKSNICRLGCINFLHLSGDLLYYTQTTGNVGVIDISNDNDNYADEYILTNDGYGYGYHTNACCFSPDEKTLATPFGFYSVQSLLDKPCSNSSPASAPSVFSVIKVREELVSKLEEATKNISQEELVKPILEHIDRLHKEIENEKAKEELERQANEVLTITLTRRQWNGLMDKVGAPELKK